MEIFKINIEEPIFLRNLLIFPVKNGLENKGLSFKNIDNVMDTKTGRFYELATPDVNKIVFDYNGDTPVLMLDGEEVTGSMQNRIIAQSFIAEPNVRSQIPVICAEENRWEEIGGFKTGYCSYPRIRSILASSFNKKVDTQHEVWKEIERKLTITRTKSRTSSMHEIFDNLNDEVERYLEGFGGLNHNTIGFIGVAGNQILGCDIFCSPEIYHKFEKKLLRSYALDAIEYQHSRGTRPDIETFFKKIITVLNNEELKSRSGHKRIQGRKFFGQMVFHKKIPIHLSAFSN
uniref:ARG and Rhodanese-Phosphatase-superfamily-associated domain-containing protein n=1 Tax=candidate division WOR-3 bacterium TaxID=2052148 RepID=A0A7V1EI08_UNCW3